MAGNDWNLQNPTRTADNLNSSIHAIDGPSSQVAGIERVFPATAREDSGYRNAARMFLAKSARNLTQERNPCINRKSVDINPMLLPTTRGGSQALVPPAARRVQPFPIHESFVQPGSANTSSNTTRRLAPITHMTSTSASMLVFKSAPSNIPWWQIEDEAATSKIEQTANLKPGDPQAVLRLDGVKRRTMVSRNTRRPTMSSGNTRELTASTDRRRTYNYLGPNMTLMVGEREFEGPEDVDMEGVGEVEHTNGSTGRVMGQWAVKSARKLQAVESESSDDSDSSSDSESYSGEESEPLDTAEDVEATRPSRSASPLLAPLLGTSPIRPIAPTERPAETILQTNQSPSEELVAALESLSLSSLRMQKTKQMPFLLRNLRRGFRLRCRAIGVPTLPSGEDVDVRIVYVDAAREGAWETRMRSWRCPLCLLHGKFGTRAMLVKHMDWDHSEVQVQWKMDANCAAPSSTWTVNLKIPNLYISDKNSSATRDQTTTFTRKERHPTPPPQDDYLGPSARHPYLPAESEYGGPTIYYSCRPGGERLYDLLGTLPMAPFGVLAWAVIDREEKIFQSDDVKDEHKVMHALWARWIVLNRNKFITDFNRGFVAFVDEYWRMIHRAAGWSALRYFLLMMMAKKFISGSEVVDLLKHFEGLTDMAHWYEH